MGDAEQTLRVPPATGTGRGKIRAVGVAVGLTVLALLLSAVVGILFAVPVFLLKFGFESTAVLVTLLLGGQIGFFAAGYLYVRYYDLEVHIVRPVRRDLYYATGGTIVALVFASGAGVVLDWLGLTPESALTGFVTEDPLILIWLALPISAGVRLLDLPELSVAVGQLLDPRERLVIEVIDQVRRRGSHAVL